MRKLLLSFFVGAALISCGPSTKIVKSWSEPGASVSKSNPNKVLAIALVKDETTRRIIEDQLVKQLDGQGVASYTLITPEVLKSGNEEGMSVKVTQGQFSHVLVMRLADVQKETSYTPGTTTGFYGGYRRYYGYGAGFYTTPGYYSTDKNYFVETMVYSVTPDKLLWSATTKTVNPSKLEKAVNEIGEVIIDKMKRDGFLK
jgi:hypothetical protein